MAAWRNYYWPPENAVKEKKFPVMLKAAVKDAGSAMVCAVLSAAAALAIMAIIVGPVVGFAMLGWWPLAVLWGVGCAFIGTVFAQSGAQLIWSWKEDHKK